MKQTILISVILFSVCSANAAEPVTTETTLCSVQVCNKLERFTLNLTSLIKDKLGENCFNIMLPKSEAFEGNILSSESKWYQGSFNPTKKSVTRVTEVYECSDSKK